MKKPKFSFVPLIQMVCAFKEDRDNQQSEIYITSVSIMLWSDETEYHEIFMSSENPGRHFIVIYEAVFEFVPQ